MRQVIFLISFSLALAYGVYFCWQDPSLLKTVVKTTALGVVALWAFVTQAPLLLALALTTSSVGDAALAVPGEVRFLVGLCSFAIAHIFYILLFSRKVRHFDSRIFIVSGAALSVLVLSTGWWLLPFTGDLMIPVAIYIILIATMGGMAAQVGGWVLIGALAFMMSDTLLAIQLFRLDDISPLQLPVSVALWTLYYCGQMLIFLAISRDRVPVSKFS
ncbi:YhhN-like protein [Pseudovibrio sp. WM33]|nr:YhhN-like protein [Pseudovibrio sp. WM33]